MINKKFKNDSFDIQDNFLIGMFLSGSASDNTRGDNGTGYENMGGVYTLFN